MIEHTVGGTHALSIYLDKSEVWKLVYLLALIQPRADDLQEFRTELHQVATNAIVYTEVNGHEA